ncbi:hypothetical protein HGRIS_014159 [Hohenbuehelia grisea]|uniref:ferric-chelate reductase (NADPH) n=1 Tax=Hohenbuehelia grisea TaxID=104357 RepID=A0ABR3JUQ1_9AGAR
MSAFPWNLTAASPEVKDDLSDFAPHPGSELAYHTDLFILALLAACVLFRLPRAIARLSIAAEWLNGHVFHHTQAKRAPLHPIAPRRPSQRSHRSTSSRKTSASEAGHTTYDSHARLAYRDEKRSYPHHSYPPHVGAYWANLRPLADVLRKRLSPGFSLGQGLLLVMYFAIILYSTLYKSSPFQDPARAGFVAMSQLPVVFALATKNNVAGTLVGLGYEKLNFFHRFVGKILVVATNVHSIGYIYKWSAEGRFTQNIKIPMVAWGLVGLVCVDVLYVFSTPIWRQRAYSVFMTSHFVGFGLLLPACWFHKPTMVPYILVSCGIYALDRFMRIVKTRIITATVRPLPELGVARVEIPHLNAGWRAGQHVRLRVLSGTGMGWLRMFESHPFTIASVSGGHEGLVLLCKKTGDWTNRLFELAKVGGYSERGIQRDVLVTVEGPYGGPGHAMFTSFSAAVFVVGGSGITFALSAIQELIQRDRESTSRIKAIELIWAVQDPISIKPLLPLFTSLIEASERAPLKISIFYTRALSLDAPSPFAKFPSHPSLSLDPGRPPLAEILESVISRTVLLGAGAKDHLPHTGMLVATCGPVGLADSVATAVSRVKLQRRRQVGGVELFEEVFGW